MRTGATSRRLLGAGLAGLAAIALTSACGGAEGTTDVAVANEIVVFAAASLTDAFTEIGVVFEAEHPTASVTFNFGASSALVAQILEGAPADVFASADLADMAELSAAGANATEPVVFATNVSEIVVASGNPLGITGVADLADPDLVLVTCAPEVPCGRYATHVFDLAAVEVTPDSYEENVRAVVTKVRLGEADAGIAYATDVELSDDVEGVPIPDEANIVAEYPVAVTTEATHPDTAQAFVDVLTSDAGRAVLARHGFSLP